MKRIPTTQELRDALITLLLDPTRSYTSDELRKQRIFLAASLHPDHHEGSAVAGRSLQRINDAYELLKDNIDSASREWTPRQSTEPSNKTRPNSSDYAPKNRSTYRERVNQSNGVYILPADLNKPLAKILAQRLNEHAANEGLWKRWRRSAAWLLLTRYERDILGDGELYLMSYYLRDNGSVWMDRSGKPDTECTWMHVWQEEYVAAIHVLAEAQGLNGKSLVEAAQAEAKRIRSPLYSPPWDRG